MKRVVKNKEMTIDELARIVAKGFENTAAKFDIEEIKGEITEINKTLESIEYRLGKIESRHERRIDILEDRMSVIKTYFERHPELKVKFD